jgi:hypothetical protein
MPGLDVAFLNNVTRAKYEKVLRNSLYNSSPWFQQLFAADRIRPMTGTALEWNEIMKKHAAFGRYRGYDVFASQPINPTVKATLPDASYYATLSISGEEKRKNKGSAEKLADMIDIQFKNAESTLKEQFYYDSYGDGTRIGDREGLHGARAGISATNTYANINRSTAANAPWRANVTDSSAYTYDELRDNSNTKYLPSVMRRMVTSCTHEYSPDRIFTTDDIWNMYQDIADTKLQLTTDEANLGFEYVKFGSRGRMYPDKYCTAGYMFFVALKDWTVHVYDGANFEMPAEGWMRPHNQDAFTTQILWSGQMKLASPWHQGSIATIATS